MGPDLDERRKAGTVGEKPVPGLKAGARPCAWCPARRSGFLRHTERSAEGCCRQALTRFAVPRCVGPDRRARHQAAGVPGPACGWFRLACLNAGGVRERPNRHDWKSCVGKLTVGSNPTLSARFGQLKAGVLPFSGNLERRGRGAWEPSVGAKLPLPTDLPPGRATSMGAPRAAPASVARVLPRLCRSARRRGRGPGRPGHRPFTCACLERVGRPKASQRQAANDKVLLSIRLAPLVLDEALAPEALRATILAEISAERLAAAVDEAECHYLDCLSHATGATTRSPNLDLHRLAAVLALATNIGLGPIGRRGQAVLRTPGLGGRVVPATDTLEAATQRSFPTTWRSPSAPPGGLLRERLTPAVASDKHEP
jgi:hypothetical protein